MQLPTLRLQKSSSFSPPPNREDAKVVGGGVRVWLMDESYKALHIDVDRITVEDLWNTACDKLGLSPQASECFYLYGCGKELELLLVGEDVVGNVIRTWIPVEHRYFPWVSFAGFQGGAAIASPKDKEAQADQAAADAREADARVKLSRSSKLGESISRTISRSISPTRSVDSTTRSQDAAIGRSVSSGATVRITERPSPVRFFLKSTEVCPTEMRRKAMSDSVALRLFYMEAVYYVLKSWYPVTAVQAVALGGLQLQAYVGDAGPQHTPGFLSAENNWKNYVPKHLRHAMTVSSWETSLLAEHVKHRGKKHDVCMAKYLEVVMGLPIYGSTFFNVKRTKAGTAFFSHEFDSNVIFGINEQGLHIIDAFSMKVETISHGQLKDWKVSDRYLHIYLKEGESKKLKFKTTQTDLINDLLGAWQGEWRGSHRSVRMSQRRPGQQDGDSPV